MIIPCQADVGIRNSDDFNSLHLNDLRGQSGVLKIETQRCDEKIHSSAGRGVEISINRCTAMCTHLDELLNSTY